ncbi:MAG: type I glyceraldehyde-3-phosphate dehydrogenase [Epsilonproteobacteria bacterium]|nr:type I glyceraldehyde-3-phosphate dehydrogenase [Campylobacterota bacterium]
MKIAINGFGRIGRSIAKVIANSDDLELVAINDLYDTQSLYYLLKYDSVHGRCDRVSFDGNDLYINNKLVITTTHADNSHIDFSMADVVFECSGRNLTTESVRHHIDKGAKRVIISAPAVDDTPTFVLGVNHIAYQNQPIISNASCTTNCLGPIAKVLDEHFGIRKGLMTTIHSYTNDQKILDVKHQKDIRRGRAAGVNMIPTTTGAAKAMYKVLPSLKGKLHGQSVRVPIADVSIVDLNVELDSNLTAQEVIYHLQQYRQTYPTILNLTSDVVSTDILQNPYSSNVDTKLITIVGGNMLKIMSWYDNEWGYANRMCDMARYILRGEI